MYKTAFVLCLSFYLALAKNEQYIGYTLYEVNVKDVEQAQLVNELENQIEVDVWTHALPNRPGQILVSPDQKQEFKAALDAAGVEYRVEVENIKETLDLEDELLAAAARSSKSTNGRLSFDTIHRHDVVNAHLEELAKEYPDVVTVVSGGRSFEGRDIKYLRISSTNFQDQNKPVVFMQSLLHAREWATLPVTLYAMRRLIIDVTEADLIRDIDWIIVPVVNPDGYEFTHSTTRLWRKNRATGYSVGNACMGVDLNRNYDVIWGTASSNSACSDTFHGRGPFSEPETAIIRDVITEHADRLELSLDIHSHGSMILYGFGNGTLPPNGLLIHLGGIVMSERIDASKWPTNPNYRVGNVRAILYAASGICSDYCQLMTGTLAYTYELPSNTGSGSGFLIQPNFIEQVGFETWEGIKAGARHALANFRSKRGLK